VVVEEAVVPALGRFPAGVAFLTTPVAVAVAAAAEAEVEGFVLRAAELAAADDDDDATGFRASGFPLSRAAAEVVVETGPTAAAPRLSLAMLFDLVVVVVAALGCTDRETRSDATGADAVLGLAIETGRSVGCTATSLEALVSGESKARAICGCLRSADEGAGVAAELAFRVDLGGTDGFTSFLVRFLRGGVLPTE
jgi:hypothetical protein